VPHVAHDCMSRLIITCCILSCTLQVKRTSASICIQRAYRHYICTAKAIATAYQLQLQLQLQQLERAQLVAAITVLQSLYRMRVARSSYLYIIRRQHRSAVDVQRICRGGTVRIRKARQTRDLQVAVQQKVPQQEEQAQQQLQIQEAAAVIIVQKAVLHAVLKRRNSKQQQQLRIQHAADTAIGDTTVCALQGVAGYDLNDNSSAASITCAAAVDDTTLQCSDDISHTMNIHQACSDTGTVSSSTTPNVNGFSAATDTAHADSTDNHVPVSEEHEYTNNINETLHYTDSESGINSSINSVTVQHTSNAHVLTDAVIAHTGAATGTSCMTIAALQHGTTAAVITVLQCNACGHHEVPIDARDTAQQSTVDAIQCRHCDGGEYVYTTITATQQQQQEEQQQLQADSVSLTTIASANTGSTDGVDVADSLIIQHQQTDSESATVAVTHEQPTAPVTAITLTAAEKQRRSQLDMHAHRIQRRFKRYQQQQSQRLQARTVLARWLLHYIQGQRQRAQYLYQLKCIVVMQACIRRHAAMKCVAALRQVRLQHWLSLTSHVRCPLTELMSDDDWHSSNSSSSSSCGVIANIDDIADKHNLHIQRMLLGHDCHTTAPHGCDVSIAALQSMISCDIQLELTPVCNPDTLVIELVKHMLDTKTT
jgi:hypothetical protein